MNTYSTYQATDVRLHTRNAIEHYDVHWRQRYFGCKLDCESVVDVNSEPGHLAKTLIIVWRL